MRRAVPILLAVAAAGLALLARRQQAELRDIRAELSASGAPPASPARPVTSPRAPAAVPADAPATNSPAVPAPRRRGRIREHNPDDVLAWVRDPKRKTYMEAAWTLNMDTVYGPLFRCFEMTPDELAYFRSLLVESWSQNEEFGARFLSAGDDAPAQAGVVRDQQAARKELDGRILEFLGADAFAEYEGYVKSLPERMQLAGYRQALANTGDPLSYEQEDQLIRLMYDERQNFPLLRDITSEGRMTYGGERPRVENVLREFEQWRARVLFRTGGLLRGDQQALFDDYLGQTRDALEVGLLMESMVNGPR